jgi:hypothetical protein
MTLCPTRRGRALSQLRWKSSTEGLIMRGEAATDPTVIMVAAQDATRAARSDQQAEPSSSEGQRTVGVDAAAGTSRFTLRDPDLVAARIKKTSADVATRLKGHEDRSRRWDYLASWGALLVALAAALSSASLLADQGDLTLGLSVATAVVAAQRCV